MKRSWTNIKAFEPKILAMRAAGKTRREIAGRIRIKEKSDKTLD